MKGEKMCYMNAIKNACDAIYKRDDVLTRISTMHMCTLHAMLIQKHDDKHMLHELNERDHVKTKIKRIDKKYVERHDVLFKRTFKTHYDYEYCHINNALLFALKYVNENDRALLNALREKHINRMNEYIYG